MTFPTSEFQDFTLNLNEPVSLSRHAGGRAVARVDYADPWIELSVQTKPLLWQERAAWEAWKAGLRGGMVSFTTWDRSRPHPIAYPYGVPQIMDETWDGEGAIADLAARLITASGAPEGFALTSGDIIGLVEGTRRMIFFVTAASVAGSSTIAIPVEPAIPLNIFTDAATVVFWRPTAEFIILGDSWQCSKRGYREPISFEAVQKI